MAREGQNRILFHPGVFGVFHGVFSTILRFPVAVSRDPLMHLFLIVLITVAMAIAVVEDLKRQKIPNIVTFPTMALAMAFYGYMAGLSGLLFSGGGLLLGIGLFIVPYAMGGMGAGDVKLMAAAGAIFGPKGILGASFLVVMIGGVYGLVLMLITPGYFADFIKRQWVTLKTLVLSRRLVLTPPPDIANRPVLKFAVPIALGSLSYMTMLITGTDVFFRLLGDYGQLFSITMH